MRVEMSANGRDSARTIEVTNTTDKASPVELSVQRRLFRQDAEQELQPADDGFLIFPPTAVIAPGAKQMFRVQYLGEPDLAQSESYYVTVEQLPVELPEGTSAIQVLLAFNVVLHVSPDGAAPTLSVGETHLETDEEGKTWLTADISNQGNKYAYTYQTEMKVKAGGEELSLSPEDIVEREAVAFLPPKLDTEIRIPLGEGDWAEPVDLSLKVVEEN